MPPCPPSLGLGLGLQYYRAGGPSLDADTVAFQTASGATNVSGIDAIASYMRAQGKRADYRLYPKKSAQNAGSGSTVYGIGGFTANNMTLVNSPTWGASGIAMNATTQFSHIADFLDAETITVFCRRSGTVGESGRYLFGQWDFAANHRSFSMQSNASSVGSGNVVRSVDGGSTNLENYRTAGGFYTTADTTYVAQWIAGGGRNVWKNKTSQGLTLIDGSIAQTNRLNSAAPILINAAGTAASAAAFMGGTYTAFLVVRGTLTTEQRETLTDLVNAL